MDRIEPVLSHHLNDLQNNIKAQASVIADVEVKSQMIAQLSATLMEKKSQVGALEEQLAELRKRNVKVNGELEVAYDKAKSAEQANRTLQQRLDDAAEAAQSQQLSLHAAKLDSLHKGEQVKSLKLELEEATHARLETEVILRTCRTARTS